MSDTTIYEPQTRALLGTASHFCEVVVLILRAAPIGGRVPRLPAVNGGTALPDSSQTETELDLL